VFAAAEEYGIEIEPDPERVERLLSTPTDVDPPTGSALRAERLRPADDRLPVHLHVLHLLRRARRGVVAVSPRRSGSGVASGPTPAARALFTFGDEPDDRYTAVHDQLDEWGYDSILEYLYRACEIAR